MKPDAIKYIRSPSGHFSSGLVPMPRVCNGKVTVCNGKVTVCNGNVTVCNGKVTVCNGKTIALKELHYY